MDDITYEFGDEFQWIKPKKTRFQDDEYLEKLRDSDPYTAFYRARWRSVYCYVYKGEELTQIIDCSEWAVNTHPEGNSEALKKFLEEKLKHAVV